MMYERAILGTIKKLKRSLLLIGPRQTGKSTLIGSLKPDLVINLANESAFIQFSSQPDLLEQLIHSKNPKTIFIDEIQRLPS